MSNDKIKIGDYVIIQRQKYTKVHKFNNIESTAVLGKDQIELRNIENQPYWTNFKMIPKQNNRKKIFVLEPTDGEDLSDFKTILKGKECGNDNRKIVDDGNSQNLSASEIEKLKESSMSSMNIVEILIENSKTFNSKTEYSQEKYLKKKEKKYFEFVQIKRPTLRLLTEIFYRQCSEKILGIRFDTLSQLISFSGVCNTGNYLLYESGTNGLLTAALLNSIGANTDAQLIHMHPGNQPQKQAMLTLNFEKEQLDRCVSVNIYSALRQYYQGSELEEENEKISTHVEDVEIKQSDIVGKTESDEVTEILDAGKKRKLSDIQHNENDRPVKVMKNLESDVDLKIEKYNSTNINDAKIPKWKLDNDRACDLLKIKTDGLVVVAKEHPSNILKSLLPFVKPSRPIVIFSLSKEILMEIYIELKASTEVTGLRLISNWVRMYQILPNRTHPDMNMSGNSGYLLYGYTVR